MTGSGPADPDIERWLADRKPDIAAAMARTRDVILGADSRMTSYLKNGHLHFGYEGDLAAFVQLDKRPVSLMFYRGARLQGDFPHLEGNGPSARFMRFAGVAEVDDRAAELAAVVAAWCRMVAPRHDADTR